MGIALRLLLFLGAVAYLYLTLLKIRKAKVQIADTIYWIGLSFVFIILSIFPDIAFIASDWLRIESPTNFVFLVVLFLLLVNQFYMSIKISKLDYEVKRLAQYISLHEKEHNDD